MSDTVGGPFILHGDETIEQFLGESADTFRTVCQVALKENKSLNIENIKAFSEEISDSFRNRLTKVATEEYDIETLNAFVNSFILTSVNKTPVDNSTDKSSSLDDEQSVDSESGDGSVDQHKYNYAETAASTPDKGDANTQAFENRRIKWLTIPAIAVQEIRIDIIKMCIKTGWPLALFRDLENCSLLSIALSVSNPNPELISLLLKYIDVNMAADKGVTPLHICMSNKSLNGKEKLELLQLLMANGADCKRMADPLGSCLQSYLLTLNFIHSARKIDKTKDIINILLQNGCDMNSVDWFGQSVLSCVISGIPTIDGPFVDADSEKEALDARKIKVDIVDYLLQKGADPNKRDKSGCSSMHVVMQSQNIDVAEILIRNGADVNALTNTRSTPIYYFCNHIEWEDETSINEVLIPMIKLLHSAKADINIQAIDGSTVLHYAAARMNQTICAFLIRLGANIAAQDYLKRTPLHMASRNKIHPAVSETLIKSGADINARDINNATPLHTACVFENNEALKFLLKNKCIVSAADELGIQPVHLAAENGDEMMLEYLISYGSDIQAEDQWKATPLHYSASDGNSETTKYLLSRGADKHRRDQRGRTPLDLSRFRGQYEVANILADETVDVKFGNFPPHLFPNRKLVKQEQVDQHFEKIIDDVKCMGSSTEVIAEAILNSAGVGRVSLSEGENREIFETVNKLVNGIVHRIGELDPIFKCILLPAGSTVEGVKIGYADEYDFVCHLEKFSSMILQVEKDAVPVYAKVLLATPVPEQYSKFCIRTSGHLNAAEILRYFHRLARQAMFDVLSRGYKNIYSGLLLLHHHDSTFSEAVISLTKLQGFSFSWRGCDHKLLDISIDLNPVVFANLWPEKASVESALLGDISKYGMFLIPKQCKPAIIAYPDQMVTEFSDLWRYSTHHIESEAMKSLPKIARDCYMLCKAFRMEPLSCAAEIARVTAEYSETQYPSGFAPIDNDEAQTFMESFKIGSSGAYRGTIDIDLMDEQDDIFEENVFNEDESEVTAESSIPSYYLKTIFLTETEKLFERSGSFSGDVWKFARSVYEKLLQSVETEHLAALFFPSQEIYSNPSHDNLTAAKEIRHLFCQNILKLIRSVERD